MTAPGYEWVCQQCGKANSAHAGMCGACGLTAFFKVAQLAVVPEAATQDIPATERGHFPLWLFFPEGIPALLMAIYTPMWAAGLLVFGNAAVGLGLMITEAVCIWGFVLGCRQGSKWLAYASMATFLWFTCSVWFAMK